MALKLDMKCMELRRVVENRRQAGKLPDGVEAANEVAKSCGK